jgi:hypothetical protein
VKDGSAGVLAHTAGIGTVKVMLNRGMRTVHIRGKDLAYFAEMYATFGMECMKKARDYEMSMEEFKQIFKER